MKCKVGLKFRPFAQLASIPTASNFSSVGEVWVVTLDLIGYGKGEKASDLRVISLALRTFTFRKQP